MSAPLSIVSASRRTDIPAWYGDWFLNRLEAGTVKCRNPFGGQVYTVSLEPEDVVAFVFWTRNAAPFLPVLDRVIDLGYRAVFQYTIVGYGPPLEGNAHSPGDAVDAFTELSQKLGPPSVRWRYDPIVLSDKMDRRYHLRNFEGLLKKIEGKTTTCHTSFVRFYRKTRRRLSLLEKKTGEIFDDPADEKKILLARELGEMAASRGVRLVSCCCPVLDKAGLPRGRCVDPDLIASLRPDIENLSLKKAPTREGCGCAASRDIGAYDTCIAGCAYCYATASQKAATKRRGEHDPEADSL